MIAGLWTGELNFNVSNILHGHSVFVFREGKTFGGNSKFFFAGTYFLEGNHIKGQYQVTHYAGDPVTPMGLIEGHSSQNFRFKGKIRGSHLEILGILIENDNIRFKGVLQKQLGEDIF
ncbi:MAG: hypothetical protein JXK94_09150 [Deltaproteobacteria bacterium]|nr:hypothetical protein [Deltaproteobacteria bacterium]